MLCPSGENEANVRWLLDTWGHCLALEPQSVRLGGAGLAGHVRIDLPQVTRATAGAAETAERDHLPLREAVGDQPVGDQPASWRHEAWLTPEEAAMVQRFDPAETDCTGFFVAKFRKRMAA